MRLQRIMQATIFENFAEHEIGRELRAMSQWLGQHRDMLALAVDDLRGCEVRATGRDGLSAESVVPCALLKQYRQLSYEELAFRLEDSASFIGFTRLPLGWSPKKRLKRLNPASVRIPTVAQEPQDRLFGRQARQRSSFVAPGNLEFANCWN